MSPSVPRDACSKQSKAPLEAFESTPGVRGKVVVSGVTHEGWILLDTAATASRVRSATKEDATPARLPARFSVGSWTADVTVDNSVELWGFAAPDGEGTQVATLETDVFVSLALRIDTRDGQVYFSDDGSACPADALRASGFHRMDTTGYYQRGGEFASVGEWEAPLVPTVEIELLGTRVRAQIDTGYAGSELEVQVNQALLQLLLPRLGQKTAETPIDGVPYDTYTPEDSAVEFIDSDTSAPCARVGPVNVLLKPGEDAIAGWDVPAALVSAAAFFKAFAAVELRADQAALWAVPRKEG
jgi:hypothetical protein